MTKKKFSRKYTDLLHVAVFVIILLLFANYESSRKATIKQAYVPSGSDASFRSEAVARTNVTSWK